MVTYNDAFGIKQVMRKQNQGSVGTPRARGGLCHAAFSGEVRTQLYPEGGSTFGAKCP